MPCLFLNLLGPFQATVEGKAIAGFESNKVRALLTYLAVEADRPQPREKLAGLLWPDWPENAARNNLRYALANLRQVIGDRDSENPLLCISRQDIQLVPGDGLEVDASKFAALLEQPGHVPENLQAAINLYHGRFLEGFSIPDSTPFEEWALLKREYYDRLMLSALHRLAAAHEARREYTQALALAWRLVELEPWHEEAQQQLMRLLALSGQRSAALAQYETCRRTLTKELGVQPSHETTSLYEQIRDGSLESVDQTSQESPHPATALPARQPVPAVKQTFTAPDSSTTGLRRRLPLILGMLAVVIISIGLVGLAYRTLGSSLSLAGTDLPTAGEFIQYSSASKMAMFCENAQHQAHICIEEIGEQGKIYLLPADLPFKAIHRTFAWSPDGRQIALSADPDVPQPGERGLKMYTIYADGSNLQQITTGGTDDILQDWSSDGAWISFNRQGGLWAIQPDGSDEYPILQGGSEVLASSWSPDNQMLAFLSRSQSGAIAHDAIWVIQRDGSNPFILYTFDKKVEEGCQIGWSPDGMYVGCQCRYTQTDEVRLLLESFSSSEPLAAEMVLPSWFSNYWPRWANP